jgi:DNA-binding CsgD family transcriptional regulator
VTDVVRDTAPPDEDPKPSLPGWLGALRSADGLFVTDDQQRIVAWSPSAAAALGYSADEVLGRRCYEVIAGIDVCSHPVCRPDCAALTNARRGRVTAAYDIAAESRDRGRVWLTNSIVLTRDETDRRPLLLHLFRPHKNAPTQPHPAPAKVPARGGSRPAPRGALQPLSRRELETLRMLAAGHTTAEIADALTISRYTARNHVNNLLRKLGARNRVEGLLIAAGHNLV